MLRPDRNTQILLLAGALGFLLKLLLLMNTVGTNDAAVWDENAQKLQTAGVETLYREGVRFYRDGISYHNPQMFIHPPPVLHLLAAWNYLSIETGLPVRFWVRFFGAIADALSLVILYRLARYRLKIGISGGLFVIALSPVSLLITGFHGNTDPIMMLLVLACVYAVMSGRSAVLAGVLLGGALGIKLAAAIFLPPILFKLPPWRERIVFMGSAGLTFACASLPHILTNSFVIVPTITGYSGTFGIWGVPRIMVLLLEFANQFQSIHEWFLPIPLLLIAYAQYGKYFVLGILCVVASQIRTANLFLMCGCSAFLFMVLTPGFGVQYLSWTVPWTLLLPVAAGLGYHAVAATFIASTYLYWCGGLPCAYANSLLYAGWGGHVILLELLVWVAVILVLREFRRRVNDRNSSPVQPASSTEILLQENSSYKMPVCRMQRTE